MNMLNFKDNVFSLAEKNMWNDKGKCRFSPYYNILFSLLNANHVISSR